MTEATTYKAHIKSVSNSAESNERLLPKGWQLKKLGDVCNLKNGYAFKSDKYESSGIPVIRISDINDGVVSSQKAVRVKANEEYENYLVKDNDILIAMSGATTGKFGIYKSPEKAYQNQRVGKFEILNDTVLYNQFLFHQINSLKRQIEKDAYGGAQPNISSTKIEQMQIVLPSLSEQQAIVAKIEELLSELENGKQQLLTAQQQLKVYRQSLLKAAYEGKLTNKNVKEGELPKCWKIVKLSDLGTWKGGGTPSKQVSKYWENGSNLWVTSKDMKIGVINDSMNKITDEAILNSSANRIPKGAILFVMRSGILRHTFPVAIAGKDLTVNQDLQTLSPNSLATSEFIYWFIRAFNNEIRQKCSKDGTTVESIESSSLKNYPFILPPLPEQKLIVSELESKLTICDKIEETISQSLQQVETLRQSILKMAFEGKLVTTVVTQREAKVIPLYKPKSEYFYQMQLLGIVAKASKQKQIEHGEMTLAKYVYLMDKVYDIPTYFNYSRWHLGPYAPAIKKVINNKQYFKKSSNHIDVLNEKKLFNSANQNAEKMYSAVNDLTDIFSKYNSKERSHKTELLATVCKVIEDIQSTDLKAVRHSMAEWKINLKGEKHKTKAEKFNEAETKKCLTFIKEKGWDKKLIQRNKK